MRRIAVTTEIRTAGTPINRFFHERFPNTGPMIEEFSSRLTPATTLYPPRNGGTPPYATLGTAIDYRLLYYFWAKPFRALDAYKGALRIRIGDPSDIVHIPLHESMGHSATRSATRLVYDFFMSLEHLLAEIRPVRRRLLDSQEALLCRYCFVLGLFEEIERTVGRTPSASPLRAFVGKATATVADLLSLADFWLDDLCHLSRLFHDRQRKMFTQQAWIHPKNIWRMAGAEADLLVEGYVIDFKTTISPRLDPTWLYQVLCYVLLEYPPEHAVRGVGFYLVRQGVLVRWRLEHLIFRLMNEEPMPLEQLRTEFRELLSGAYGLYSQWSFLSGRKPWRGAPWGA